MSRGLAWKTTNGSLFSYSLYCDIDRVIETETLQEAGLSLNLKPVLDSIFKEPPCATTVKVIFGHKAADSPMNASCMSFGVAEDVDNVNASLGIDALSCKKHNTHVLVPRPRPVTARHVSEGVVVYRRINGRHVTLDNGD